MFSDSEKLTLFYNFNLDFLLFSYYSRVIISDILQFVEEIVSGVNSTIKTFFSKTKSKSTNSGKTKAWFKKETYNKLWILSLNIDKVFLWAPMDN